MFAFGESGKPAAKCFVSYGPLPRFIDPKEPPRRKKPFSAILKNPFFHTVELCLPEEVYLVVQDQLQIDKTQPKYLRVIMPLGALLEREFLNGYIKEGNIMMLSEGRAGIDNVFSLKEDIDIDLRLPAMVHGKKGFQRLVWAAENVLTLPIQWIICNNGGDMSSLSAALARHHPIETHADPRVSISPSLLEPDFLRNDPLHDSFPEFLAERVVELREWLALVSLGSPRVEESDSIDPFLSRYQFFCPIVLSQRVVFPQRIPV
ncbi:MAG: hypothetical protein M1829_003926 [Trizodia sp. TS-e1964]|nr:MAG: hypothetical protein M1829_003926 [Trizodia sp. TS-e1964]